MWKAWKGNTALYVTRLWIKRQIYLGGSVIRVVLRSVCINAVRPDFNWVDVALAVALITVLMFSIVGSRG